MKTKLMTICTVVVMLLAVSGVAQATISDFEAFSTGQSINGQGGWTVEDSFGHDPVEAGKSDYFDEEVVDLGGNNVWRVSNAFAYSEYSFQPFSQTAPLVAGEAGSYLYNDKGTDHTNPYRPPHEGAAAQTNYFYAAFDLASATGAAQSGLSITLSPSAKQSTVRMGWLNISDSGSGLDLLWYGTGAADDPWAPDYVNVATGLSYTDTHHVEMMITFNDGINGDLTGNDVVALSVNGSPAGTSTTWETYYYATGEGVTEPRLQAVDSLLFRMSTADASLAGGGVYFDNVEISNVPEPATMCILGLGGLLLRRKRRA